MLIANIGKTRAVVILPVHLLVPHGQGTDPKAAFTVECAIDHHRLFCFGVTGEADHFIFIAFEMAVFSGLKFHNCSF